MDIPRHPSLVISASSQRSGSTWVQRIVHAATDIFVWGESFPLVELLSSIYSSFKYYEDIRSQETRAFLSSNQDPTVWIANTNPPIDGLIKGFVELFSKFYETYGRAQYGWKEVRYSQKELEFLWELFPKLRVVLLVRNPLDVVRSLRNLDWIGRWVETQSVSTVCHNWSHRTRDYLLLKDNPNVFFLRYEDVPSKLDQLLAFVGGTFRPEVNQALLSDAGKSSIQNALSFGDKQTVLRFCAEEMKVLGYLDADNQEETSVELARQSLSVRASSRSLEKEKWDNYYAELPLMEEDKFTGQFNAEFVKHIQLLLPSGGRVLEAGCGGGWQSLALARTGAFQQSLMDFSGDALMYARRLFEREQLSADFLLKDVFETGNPDFDLVFNAGVLEHYTFDQQVAFLRGMASRTHKYVMVLVPNRLCYWYWLWRVHQSGNGKWPYGKEVPLMDLSGMFEAAGIHFLGQMFMGETWAEIFINGMDGIDESVRNQLLQIHRSPLIPQAQKSYLLAALGTVSLTDETISTDWTTPASLESTELAEVSAALADALALRISAESKLIHLEQLTIQTAEQAQKIDMLQDRCAVLDQSVDVLTDQLKWKNQTIQSFQDKLVEQNQLVQSVQQQLVEREQVLQNLQSKIGETTQSLTQETERANWWQWQFNELYNARALKPVRVLWSAKIGLGNLLRDLRSINVTRAVYQRLPMSLRPPAKTIYTRMRSVRSAVTSQRLDAKVPGIDLPNRGVGEKDKVSVILLPVHKRADWIKATIESVLTQTYENLELLVIVDDSFSEIQELGAIVDQLWQRAQLIVLSKPADRTCLQVGLEAASGEYVTWLTDESLMQPEQMKQLVSHLETNPDVQMVFSDYELMNETGLHVVRLGLSKNQQPISPSFLTRMWVGRLLMLTHRSAEDPITEYWRRVSHRFSIWHAGNLVLCRTRRQDYGVVSVSELSKSQLPSKKVAVFCNSNIRRSIKDGNASLLKMVSFHDLDDARQLNDQYRYILLLGETDLDWFNHFPRSSTTLTAFLLGKDSFLPYRLPNSTWQKIDLVFATDESTASRARLFTKNVFVVPSYRHALDLCVIDLEEGI